MHPYLSIVVAARNDNYGGDFLQRMGVFLSVLAALSDRHRLRPELVVVEWNPPANKPRLAEAVSWPHCGLAIRVVQVPEEVHRILPNSARMPMFEYIAKNVGVRRARGEFVLVTNPDIIFSDEVIAHFAASDFSADSFERVDRSDVRETIPSNVPVDALLRFCNQHVIVKHQVDGPVIPIKSVGLRSTLGMLVPKFLSRPNPMQVMRWFIRMVRNHFSGESTNVGEGGGKLHLGAAGDFLLMATEQWHRLRAFPEVPTESHIDNYMVHLASASGLKQRILPHPIYHQEHDRTEQVSRPLTEIKTWSALNEMLATGRPVITNGADWGLGRIALPEYEISPRNQ